MTEETLERSVHRHADGRTLTVTVRGEWDSQTDGTLASQLRPVLAEGYRDVILDVTDVSFCDSVCVSSFVEVHRLVTTAGGSFRVVAPNHAVRRTLEITGLDQVITLDRTRPDAEIETDGSRSGPLGED
jgi:anti-sigma B factor antagonist